MGCRPQRRFLGGRSDRTRLGGNQSMPRIDLMKSGTCALTPPWILEECIYWRIWTLRRDRNTSSGGTVEIDS